MVSEIELLPSLVEWFLADCQQLSGVTSASRICGECRSARCPTVAHSRHVTLVCLLHTTTPACTAAKQQTTQTNVCARVRTATILVLLKDHHCYCHCRHLGHLIAIIAVCSRPLGHLFSVVLFVSFCLYFHRLLTGEYFPPLVNLCTVFVLFMTFCCFSSGFEVFFHRKVYINKR